MGAIESITPGFWMFYVFDRVQQAMNTLILLTETLRERLWHKRLVLSYVVRVALPWAIVSYRVC
jgi:hypothetical protein